MLVLRGKEVRVQKLNNRFVCVTEFSRADKAHVVPAPDEQGQASADGDDESKMDVESVLDAQTDGCMGGGGATGDEDAKSEAETAPGWQQLDESPKMPPFTCRPLRCILTP